MRFLAYFLAYFLVVYCVLLPAAFLFWPSAVFYFLIPNCLACLVAASIPAVLMMECFRTPSLDIGRYIWTAFYSIVLVLLLLLAWMAGFNRPDPESVVNVMFAALICVPTTMVLILRTVEQKRLARQLRKETLLRTLGFMNSEIDQVLYDRVIRLIVSELNLNRDELHPETRLYHDLGCTGLDGDAKTKKFPDLSARAPE